ncbi:MAPEG family protein [Teredinibacter turnerae]|uniref:MAPEG family protein n=1 Tax=Teredinibacter turnerae TaxID=2426 RepID=UPI00037FD7E9|nr:MAPEG family protein [Teredinibacter turnerae]
MTTSLYTSLAAVSLWFIIVTVVVQSVVAATVKARQPGAVPGKMPENLSHDSFVFRAQRTFMNSLENTPLMLATGLLALVLQINGMWTGVLLAVYAVARILHMALYYGIATERNPSPRSYFFLIGLLANMVLLGVIGVEVLS